MEFLSQYGLFLVKTLTLVVSFLLVVAGVLALGRKPKPVLEITSLNKEYETTKQRMSHEIKNKKTREGKKR